jgi:hypothetical protein
VVFHYENPQRKQPPTSWQFFSGFEADAAPSAMARIGESKLPAGSPGQPSAFRVLIDSFSENFSAGVGINLLDFGEVAPQAASVPVSSWVEEMEGPTEPPFHRAG